MINPSFPYFFDLVDLRVVFLTGTTSSTSSVFTSSAFTSSTVSVFSVVSVPETGAAAFLRPALRVVPLPSGAAKRPLINLPNPAQK
jgi:hypothetical protein